MAKKSSTKNTLIAAAADGRGGGGRIVCAGIPRSGTTLMFRALAGLPPGGITPKDYAGPVVKTHTFRPEQYAADCKALFMFGDPVQSVVSTRLRRFDRQHFRNCGAEELDPATADIYRADLLNYERMFDAWYRRQGFPVILARYETLYDNLAVIADFFGFYLCLPPRRPRHTDPAASLSHGELTAVRRTYKRLIGKVAAAPDVAIFRP